MNNLNEILNDLEQQLKSLGINKQNIDVIINNLNNAIDILFDDNLGCLALREVFDEDNNKYGYIIKLENKIREWIDEYLEDYPQYYFIKFSYIRESDKLLDYIVEFKFINKDNKENKSIYLPGYKFKGLNKKEYFMLFNSYFN